MLFLMNSRPHHKLFLGKTVLALAALNSALQIVWFWKLTRFNINYDAISYVGIARHIAEGNFRQALHGYWSPLISWAIAALSLFSSDFTLLARVVTIGSFLCCLPLLYLLTLRLWRSSLAAAVAVLWFTMARGVVPFSVYFIGADFLLTAIVLIYFILLLHCLQQPRTGNWVALGIPHALAFLAKAFAMPWLTLSTVFAALLARRHGLKRTVLCGSVAFAIPLLVWLGWGNMLKLKYGVFTAGYQSRWNLLNPETRESAERRESRLSVLYDTSRMYDSYMVVDNLYPGSLLWQERMQPRETFQLALNKERRNLPRALKQLVILLTPGGMLALLVGFCCLSQKKGTAEKHFAEIAFASVATLIVGYCFLVFDERYILPAVPLLIAVGVPWVLPGSGIGDLSEAFPKTRALACVLLIASTIFSLSYWASPFRTLRRDYQVSSYDTAQKLRALPSCKNLVVVGRGPYPEHGLGWEAGLYAGYFAGCRMIAFNPDLPDPTRIDAIETDLKSVDADAILVLGSNSDPAYSSLTSAIKDRNSKVVAQEIVDPQAGEIGQLLWSQSDDRASTRVAINVH
jgi:hypothetical protein